MLKINRKYLWNPGMKWFLLLSALFIWNEASAQQGFVTTGDDITTGYGSVNYSVGQLMIVSDSTRKGSVMTGLQIPIEILRIPVGISEDESGTNIEAFPNPTFDQAKISIDKQQIGPFLISIIDMKGTIKDQIEITNNEHIVSLSDYPSGTYSILISKLGITIATYSIIKH